MEALTPRQARNEIIEACRNPNDFFKQAGTKPLYTWNEIIEWMKG
jgi:hypothetical protein